MSETRSLLRSATFLVGVLVLARLAFIAFMPATYSNDMRAWVEVVRVMSDGGNPYQTGLLNWPPLWPTILRGLMVVADGTGWSMIVCVQIFLIAVDGVNLLLVRSLVLRTATRDRFAMPLLVGLALNPTSILLTAQHGNFDALVALWLLLFIGSLWAYLRTGVNRHWYCACLFLGMGVLTKTIPLLLAPLLLAGHRQRTARTMIGGFALFLAPLIIGMVPLLIADAPSVLQHVVNYRSYAGWFGITGILKLVDAETFAYLYRRAAPILFLAIMAWAAWKMLRQASIDHLLLLRMVIVLLLGIVILGPGYSPQYIGWYLPLLVLLFMLGSDAERRTLTVAFVVCTMTYCVEYALIPSHGAFLLRMTDNATILSVSARLTEPGMQTLLRVPLFVTYLALTWSIVKALRIPSRPIVIGEHP